MRCLPSSICLRCSSRICSNRGGSWKSRTSFFVTSSTSPSGVHRAVCGCVGATGRCWYGCHGFGQACLGRPGSFNLTRYCGGIEQDFAPMGAGNPALGQGGLRLARESAARTHPSDEQGEPFVGCAMLCGISFGLYLDEVSSALSW